MNISAYWRLEGKIVKSEYSISFKKKKSSEEVCVPGQRCCRLPAFPSQESESEAGCRGSGTAADQNPSGAFR